MPDDQTADASAPAGGISATSTPEPAGDPALRRRKIGIGVATLAVLGAVGVVVGAMRDEPCTGAAQIIADTWSEAEREKIAAAFADTEVPHAVDAADAVAGRLDTYATDWVEMHEDACEATNVRHEQSAKMLDERMACLQRNLAALDAFVTQLQKPVAKVVARAPRAVRRLPEIDACGDLDRLRTDLVLLEGVGAARAEAAREMLARAEALELLGRHDEALVLAQEATRSADKARDRPLRAEAQLVEGRVLAAAKDAAGAVRALEAADADARVAGHDHVAAAVETLLVHVVGVQQGRHERALWWADRAKPAIERVGDDPRLDAELAHNLGLVSHAMGRHEAARDHLRRALQQREQRLGTEHPDTIDTVCDLAAVVDAVGDRDKAEELYARAASTRPLGCARGSTAAPQ